MNLLSIRIITADVPGMTAFYEHVTGGTAIRHTPDFAELQTGGATLAIGSTRTLQLFGGTDVAEAAHNRSVIVEFITADVEASYQRLAGFLDGRLVQQPTLMPWGNSSLLFRDPDGNLVNFFTPVSPDAIARFGDKMPG